MENNVILSIRGQQSRPGEEPEVVELVTQGTLERREGAGFTLRYLESELTGMEGTRTTLQIEDGRVILLREGQFNSQVVFEQGRRHLSMYNTPFGALSIGVSTRRMQVELEETGGDIEIDYAMEVGSQAAGENRFHINVRSRGLVQ